MKTILFLIGLSMLIIPSARGQQITQLTPPNLALRAVAFSPVSDGIYGYDEVCVGDSGVCERLFRNSELPYFFIDKSVTLLAAAYSTLTKAAVAGTNGKVYYTADGGAIWDAGVSGTSATIRAMTRGAAGALFAVGDSGIILKSTDYGQKWTHLASPVMTQLNAIIFGTVGNYAIAVGNDTTIIVSTDSGSTWNREVFPYDLSPLGSEVSRVDFSSVAMSSEGDSVWVGLEKPVLPLLLINGKADPGQTLIAFPNSGPLTSLLYIGDTDYYVLGLTADDYRYSLTNRGIFTRSIDTWEGDADGNIDTATQRVRCAALEPSPVAHWRWLYNAPGDELNIITDFRDSTGTVIDLGENYVTNEEDYLDADVHADGEGYYLIIGGTIERTTNGGITRDFASPDSISKLNSIWCADEKTAITIGWDGLILRTEDSGTIWQNIPSGTQERLHGIAFATADTGVIVGDFGYIIRSTDTGLSWNPIVSPTTQYLYAVAFATPETGVATGDSAIILRTTDAGVTWSVVNNILTGTNTSIRHVQAFQNGTFMAQAGANLLRSTDFGENWLVVPSPGDSIGMSFYNPQIGIIAQRSTSSEIVPDTAYVWYTTDGGNDWSPVVIPIYNERRIVVSWLNDHTAMLYGLDGSVDELGFTSSGVTLTPVPPMSSVSVYPNPSSGNVIIDYTTKSSGPVTIELWDESGKRIQQLFSGEQVQGFHELSFTLPSTLHGAFFIRLSADGKTSTAPVSKE